MIMLPAAVRIFLCSRPTDMRKSFDGLTGLVQECFGQDPLTGHLFLFVNRRRDRIKILYFDRDGLALWYKKFESDYPHPHVFTELGRPTDNRIGRPDAAGGMD
jgi:transposase